MAVEQSSAWQLCGLLQLLRSPSCLAGCSRSSRKAALTRSGLPSRPQRRRMLRASAWRGCWTKRGEVESAEDAFGARGFASPGPPGCLPVPALYALGNMDFLRATGIWHPVRCLSRWRCTGNFGFWEFTTRNFFLRPLVSGSHLCGVF